MKREVSILEIFENKIEITRSVLVSVDTGEFDSKISLEELEELSNTAGVLVVGKITQNLKSYEKATLVGKGKLEEIAEFCKNYEIDLIIFDHEMTATQIRNVEDATGVRVIDRTMLILDIFASRALSKEGKLQVELALQRYRLPRLTGMGVQMARLKSAVGARGPGETKLEVDKRHIRNRITALQSELLEIEKRRSFTREKRKKDNVITVAIVGYTNVGKSTLLNQLTDANVLAENKLFATLDPTARGIELPDGRSVLLIDTVGVIRRLPHHLIKAFRSTLSEASNSNLILHVCDISSEEVVSQIEVTETLLQEIGCEDIPIVRVYNKCDEVKDTSSVVIDDASVLISAKYGQGLDELLLKIQKYLPSSSKRLMLTVPFNKANLIATIRENGKIYSEEYTENGVEVDALVENKILHLVDGFIKP
jgi:GTP-binding protein HflX